MPIVAKPAIAAGFRMEGSTMAGIISRTNVFFSGKIRAAFAVAVLAGLTGMDPVALAGADSDIIEQPANMPGWFFERRIVGDNNLEKIEAAKASKHYDMTRPIAIVRDLTGEGFCTGWRVAEDLFVTNYHCYEFAGCKLVFELDYETARSGEKHPQFTCVEALAQNEEFDYAIYKVKPAKVAIKTPKPAKKPKTLMSDLNESVDDSGVITMWGGAITVGQPLIVSGHPAARTKEIDRSKDCKINTIVPEEMGGRMTIRHTCDTEGGSSGSPVLDRKTGYAVALHWGGEDGYNMAIPMNLVLNDIEKNVDAETFAKLTIAGRK